MAGRSLLGVQPDQVAFGVDQQRDEAEGAYGCFCFVYLATGGDGSGLLDRGVFAAEVGEGAAGSCGDPLLLDQGSAGTPLPGLGGKRLQLGGRLRAFEFFELHFEHLLVGGLGPLQILHIDLDPGERVCGHGSFLR